MSTHEAILKLLKERDAYRDHLASAMWAMEESLRDLDRGREYDAEETLRSTFERLSAEKPE